MTITLTPHAAADLERLARAGETREAIVERALAMLAERESVTELRASIEDVEAGRTFPADEVHAELRREFGLGPRS